MACTSPKIVAVADICVTPAIDNLSDTPYLSTLCQAIVCFERRLLSAGLPGPLKDEFRGVTPVPVYFHVRRQISDDYLSSQNLSTGVQLILVPLSAQTRRI